MTERLSPLFYLPMVLLGLGAAVYWFWTTTNGPERPITAERAAVVETERVVLELYFPEPGGYSLRGEQREVLRSSPTTRSELVWAALVEGPRQDGPPSGLVGRAVLFRQGDLVTVRPDRPVPVPPTGAWAEALTMACLVRSLTASVDGVERVRLLEPRSGRTTGHLFTNGIYGLEDVAGWMDRPGQGEEQP